MTIPREYTRIPKFGQWKSHSKVPSIRVWRKHDPTLLGIDAIMKALERTKENGTRNYLIVELYFTTNYWLRNFKTHPRGSMHPDRGNAIRSLLRYSVKQMAKGFGCGIQAVPTKLEQFYGRTMGTHGVTTDATEPYHYLKRADIEQYKLFFDKGKVYCFDWENKRHGQEFVLELANTEHIYYRDTDMKSLQLGWARFAMSMSRDIYLAPHIPFKAAQRFREDGAPAPVCHSSYLAGKPVLCAGSMEINQGIITGLKSDSGHYRPTYQQLMNVIQHLAVVGVDISKVSVCDFLGWPLGTGREFLRNNEQWRKRLDETGQEFRRTNNLHDLVAKRVALHENIIFFSDLKEMPDNNKKWEIAYKSVCEDLATALNDPNWRKYAEEKHTIPRRKAPAPPQGGRKPPPRPTTPHPPIPRR